jgi:Spy/CpxP family protein refolding chaperone
MKKSLYILVFTMLSTLAFAQQHDGDRSEHGRQGEGRSREQVEKMKTALSLNDEQYASIKAIDEKYRTKHHALKKDTAATKADKVDAMKAIHKERSKEIAGVLTSEQQDKWKAFNKAQSAQRKADRAKAKAERRENLKTTLALTDEQASKMEAIDKKFHAKMKASKKEESPKDKKKALFKQYRDEHDAEIKAILTPDQLEKYQAIKSERRKQRKHQKGK